MRAGTASPLCAATTAACDVRRYRLFEWVAAYIVLFGAMLFLLYDKDAAEHHDERHIESSLGGLALVVIS